MKLSRKHRQSASFMNMTPMIDIVFLLIIFFISVSQITRVNEEVMQLPTLEAQEDKDPVSVTINVTESGEIKIQGQVRSLSDTVLIVGEQLAAVDNEPSMLRVLLRADKRGTSRTVNELVTQLGQLGITQVRIGVETPR